VRCERYGLVSTFSHGWLSLNPCCAHFPYALQSFVNLVGSRSDVEKLTWRLLVQLRDSGQEMLLNKLLNEMDGLREDAEVIFILTTNRPDQLLEPALASRPGRIDQAIEFPLPDDIGRAKLARLYGQGLELDEDIVGTIVSRSKGVSAAFIKELMRRSAQFLLQAGRDKVLTVSAVDAALEEMVILGGSLNLKLLGASDSIPGNTSFKLDGISINHFLFSQFLTKYRNSF
jgi:SpoVK/Ycf46/Vps4 family AAA+-type ATPase